MIKFKQKIIRGILISFIISIPFFTSKIHAIESEIKDDKYIGVSAGINNTNTINDTVNANSLVMPWIGFNFERIINDYWKFQAGAELNIKGRRFDQPEFLSEKYYYLSIPLSLKFSSAGIFSYSAGVYPGLLITSNRTFLEGQSSLGTKSEMISNVSPYDLSVLAGIDFQLSSNVNLSLKYHHSLIPYLNNDTEYGFRHHGLQIGVTFRFSNEDLSTSNTKPVDTLAAHHIKNLKNGALMVRLQTNSHLINALKNDGQIERANEYEVFIKEENHKIMTAFNNYFDFCPIYFFHSYKSKQLLMNNFEDSFFLDTSLNYIPLMNFDYDEFYIVDFAKFFNEVSGFEMDGFVIKNRYFATLKRPFPYFVTIQEATGLRTTYNKLFSINKDSDQSALSSFNLSQDDFNSMVIILNNRLTNFYLSLY